MLNSFIRLDSGVSEDVRPDVTVSKVSKLKEMSRFCD